MNTIKLAFIFSLITHMGLYSMEQERKALKKSSPSLLKQVLLDNHENKRKEILQLRLEEFPKRLEFHYQATLAENIACNPDLLAAELPETVREQLTEFRNIILSFGESYQQIQSPITQFKKEKGFLIIPKIAALDITTLISFHATYSALIASVNELDSIN